MLYFQVKAKSDVLWSRFLSKPVSRLLQLWVHVHLVVAFRYELAEEGAVSFLWSLLFTPPLSNPGSVHTHWFNQTFLEERISPFAPTLCCCCFFSPLLLTGMLSVGDLFSFGSSPCLMSADVKKTSLRSVLTVIVALLWCAQTHRRNVRPTRLS